MIVGMIAACWIITVPSSCVWTTERFERVENCLLWLDDTARKLSYGKPEQPVKFVSCGLDQGA